MSRLARLVLPGVLAVLLTPLAAQAQFLSEKVGFNGPGLPADSQEMFRIPEFNATSAGFIIKNTTGQYDFNAAHRAGGLFTEGNAAERVFFRWKDPNNPANTYSWVRLSTFNGPIRPNPSLHLGGKVRFKIINLSEVIRGRVGLAVGVRETGTLVPQMEDGGVIGTVELAGTLQTANGITAGVNGIVNTTAAGDDVQVRIAGFDVSTDPNIIDKTGFAIITPGANGTIDTVPAGDDVLRKGYSLDPNQARYPIPVVTLVPSGASRSIEINLPTGAISFNGTPQANSGYAPLSGDGNGAVDPNSRGTLECLAITKVSTDIAQLIDFAVDELQFEAPVADPTRPPLLEGPLVASPTPVQITISGIQYAANRVQLWRVGNASPIATDSTGFPKASATLTVPSLQAGQVYYATVRNGQTGLESAPSNEQTVYATPPPISFSMLLDEGGSGSCTFNPPGWEWIGVTEAVTTDPIFSDWSPQGQALIVDSSIWQTIDIPLDDPLLVRAGLGGNGALAASPVGYYTIDSVWFSVQPNTPTSLAGPWEVLIDGVQVLNSSGSPTQTILTMESAPGFNAARGQSWEALNSASGERTSNGSFDGAQAARISFDFDGDGEPNYVPPGGATIDPLLSLGVLQRSDASCNRSAKVPDSSSAVRFHVVVRALGGDPNVPLPVIQAPVIGQQATIRVDNDASATLLQVYINGVLAGNAVPVGTPTDIAVTLDLGDSVAVKQTLPGNIVSDYSYPRAATRPLPPGIVGPIIANATTVNLTGLISSPLATASQVTIYKDNQVWATADPNGATSLALTVTALPNGAVVFATQTVNNIESLASDALTVGAVPSAPAVSPPLEAGDITVRVQGLTAGTTLVRVYDGNSLIGEAPPPSGATFFDCPVTPLVHLHKLKASQVNPSGESPQSTTAKEVGRGNGDMFVTLGIRESNSTAPIGEPSPYAGDFEWIGATGVAGDAPVGKPVAIGPTWQTLIFDPNVDPIRVTSLAAGTGVIETNIGMLEHLGLTLDANSVNRSVGAYRIYIDNVINVGADPNTGADVNIGAGFESYTLGQEVMFQEPGYSGSTSGNIEAATTYPLVPNSSQISDEYGNSGKSIRVRWVFTNSLAGRWIRLTTFQSGVPLYRPTINLRKPLKFDILVLAIFPPDPPTLSDAVLAGDTVVTVRNIVPDATEVRVFANGVQIGSINPNGNSIVDVPVTGLIPLDAITARQVSDAGVGLISNTLEVGRANGAIKIAIGVRETGDTGPLGSQGSTATAPIEFVGVTAVTSTAPQGIPVSPSPVWQTLTFNLQDPNSVESFSGGNGTIDGTRGTIEHLAVAVDSASPNRSAGIYRLYIDNVVNVGADPNTGGDFVIADFEGFPIGGEALFQEPTFSGTTAANLLALPSYSGVSDTFGNPGNSAWLRWVFRDTTVSRWARIATSSVARVPSPIIDLTKPIRLDVLLVEDCVFKGDLDGDYDVDIDDFDLFAACLLGVDVQVSPACTCADFDDDGKVDLFDAAEFQASFNP